MTCARGLQSLCFELYQNILITCANTIILAFYAPIIKNIHPSNQLLQYQCYMYGYVCTYTPCMYILYLTSEPDDTQTFTCLHVKLFHG